MRYIAGLPLLLVVWPLLILLDMLLIASIVGLLAWGGGPLGINAGIKLTELVFK